MNRRSQRRSTWTDGRTKRNSTVDEAPAETRLTRGWQVYAFVRSAVLTVGAALGALCIVVFAAGMIFGVKPAMVVSGSMEPTIPVGALTFSVDRPASELSVGQVVMVDRGNDLGLVTHRIVDIADADADADAGADAVSLTLRGDNNDIDDPLPYVVDHAAVVIFHTPYLGFVADFLQRFWGPVALIVLSTVVGFYLLDADRIGKSVPRGTDSDVDSEAEA